MAAGKAFGFFFHRRNHTSVLVREPKGDAEVEMEYEILNILEFDSTRKRMSVICRNPEGNIMLYCKVCCSAAQHSCLTSSSSLQKQTCVCHAIACTMPHRNAA